MTQATPYELGQTVRIRALDLDAQVLAVMKDMEGTTYRIAWWYNGQRYNAWVHPQEIFAPSSNPNP